MQLSKRYFFKLYFLTILLILAQLFINSTSVIYVDILGVFLIVLLINKFCLFRQLIILAMVADLIGRWYLGTHLFAIILISFFSDRYYNFYKLSGSAQKIISIMIFTIIEFMLNTLIGLLTNSVKIDFFSIATEIIILCPLIFLITAKLLKTPSSDIIFT